MTSQVQSIEIYTPPAPMTPRAYTQLGNAERYFDLYGADTKYIATSKQWLVWNGSRWVPDEKLTVKNQMVAMIRRMVAEATAAMAPENSAEERERGEDLYKWARRCENEPQVMGSMKMLEGLTVESADMFDQNDWLLNFPNGTLDLASGDFRECRKEDYITKTIPFEYDDLIRATCPQWMQFLSEVFPGKYAEIIPYLQRAVGYCLTGDTTEQCLWLLIGKGRNGKGVFIHTLEKMMGEYYRNADWQTFTHHRSQGLEIREDILRLKDARFVAASENDKTVRLAENIVKTVTGDDTVTARKQYHGSQDFKPKFKLWLASNHEPKIIGQDDGIWSRLRYVEFTVSFLGREDKGLEKRLRRELLGILNWALIGLQDWQREGMQTPDLVRRRTEEFRKGSDQINLFFDAKVTTGGKIGKGALYSLYKQWAENGGEFILTEREFNAAIEQRGIEGKRFTNGNYWVGIHDRFNMSVETEANKERVKADATEDAGQSDLGF
jgi:putative DNA primase/helicase